jgi:glycosyltransferase involved in cell wall biosynthesis
MDGGEGAQIVRKHDDEAPNEILSPRLRVDWFGPPSAWFELVETQAELRDVVVHASSHNGRVAEAEIAQLARPALRDLGKVRERLPSSAIVLDLAGDGETELSRLQARKARRTDAVLVGSHWECSKLLPRLEGSSTQTAVIPRPVDLEWFATEAQLEEAKGRGRDLRRFRRFHRLAGPMVLFAGPYTEAGGLDVLVELVFELRERIPDLRLAAIPHGAVDARYRDRCEMRMLALGHHGIVEWEPTYADVPFWYATATLVCAPARVAGSPEPAKRAAAAGRPFVATDLEPFREHVVDEVTGYLVDGRELNKLRATLEGLLTDESRAHGVGETARRKAENEYAPAVAARALRGAWEEFLLVRQGQAPRGG